MSRATLTWANRSTIFNTHSNTRQKYQSTVDQARAYAAELGPDLALAFDTLSNKTALALRAFVAAMYQEGHSYGEIENIRDAMKQYFEDRFLCIGTYWQFLPDEYEATIDNEGLDKDEERGEWIGNPIFDKAFVDMMQELKDQDERSDTCQAKRRTAIGYEDITKLMLHLQNPETIEAEGLARCLFFQAFAATAFTLWLTFDEVLKLKRGNVLARQADSDRPPSSFSITVPFRNSNPIDPAQANVYEIYLQPEEPHSCCATHLQAWIQQLELKKGQKLQQDDCLFPDLVDNDQIQQKKPFSVTQVSELLNKYAAGAGIMAHRYNRLDTHCFRRGGAQHRLSQAQNPWPLKAIKWWGGWSEREPAEKILEYLWDDFQYEASFGDIMSTLESKARVHARTARLTEETMVTRECLKSTIRSIESRHIAALAKIEKEVQELRQQNMEFRQESTEWRGTINLQLEKVVHCSLLLERRIHLAAPFSSQIGHSNHLNTQKNRYSSHSYSIGLHTSYHWNYLSESIHSHYVEYLHWRSRRKTIPAISHWKEAIQQWEQGDRDRGLDVPLSEWTLATKCENATYYNRKLIFQEYESFGRSGARMRKVYGKSMDRLKDLVIAIRSRRRLEEKGVEDRGQEAEQQEEEEEEEEEEEGPKEHWPNVPKVKNWRQAVQQWEMGDPECDLEPISRWPPEWQRSRHTHSSYLRRKIIAEEYEYCGRDEHRMRRLHGRAVRRLDDLVASINRRKRLRQLEKARTMVNEENVEGEEDESGDEWEDESVDE
ncbi:hypothetical protein MVEG_01201 [Podila verticillata NRRL 6337]|nr:hypothetical protein MVEG_01201 [Podila verticillata NRRL 6337]